MHIADFSSLQLQIFKVLNVISINLHEKVACYNGYCNTAVQNCRDAEVHYMYIASLYVCSCRHVKTYTHLETDIHGLPHTKCS